MHRDPCGIPAGSEVLVLFTSFAGIDPHWLLLQSASSHNISIYFGLPSLGTIEDDQDILAYYQLVYRILNEHRTRYQTNFGNTKKGLSFQNTPYDTLRGYYSTDEVCLAAVSSTTGSFHVELYQNLGYIVHLFGRKFAISPYIILNKYFASYSLGDHVSGFEILAETRFIDVIAYAVQQNEFYGAYSSANNAGDRDSGEIRAYRPEKITKQMYDNAKKDLLALSPSSYTGIAAKLAKDI